MANFNWVDYVVLVVFFLSILSGFARGLVREVVSLLTWIAAFIVAVLFTDRLAALLANMPIIQRVTGDTSTAAGAFSYLTIGISFALLFAGTIIVGALIGLIINSVVAASGVGIVNRLLGGLFGLGRGYIIVLVLIFLVQLTSMGTQSWWHESQFAVSFQPTVQWLGDLISPSLANLKERFGQTVQEVGSQLQDVTSKFPSLRP